MTGKYTTALSARSHRHLVDGAAIAMYNYGMEIYYYGGMEMLFLLLLGPLTDLTACRSVCMLSVSVARCA